MNDQVFYRGRIVGANREGFTFSFPENTPLHVSGADYEFATGGFFGNVDPLYRPSAGRPAVKQVQVGQSVLCWAPSKSQDFRYPKVSHFSVSFPAERDIRWILASLIYTHIEAGENASAFLNEVCEKIAAPLYSGQTHPRKGNERPMSEEPPFFYTGKIKEWWNGDNSGLISVSPELDMGEGENLAEALIRTQGFAGDSSVLREKKPRGWSVLAWNPVRTGINQKDALMLDWASTRPINALLPLLATLVTTRLSLGDQASPFLIELAEMITPALFTCQAPIRGPKAVATPEALTQPVMETVPNEKDRIVPKGMKEEMIPTITVMALAEPEEAETEAVMNSPEQMTVLVAAPANGNGQGGDQVQQTIQVLTATVKLPFDVTGLPDDIVEAARNAYQTAGLSSDNPATAEESAMETITNAGWTRGPRAKKWSEKKAKK